MKFEGNPKTEFRNQEYKSPISAFRIAAFCILSSAGFLAAQSAPNAPFVTRSQSGQFVIHAVQAKARFAPGLNLDINTNAVRLDAARLTVSSERIKDVLARNLATTAPWRGKVHLYLHPAHGSDETITITSEQFKDGWQYAIYLPDVVERARYVRALVQVLLLEMANRNAGAHGAEVPLWLTEGLTQQLLSDKTAELIPPPPRRGGKGLDGLDIARTVDDIKTNQPLVQAHREMQMGKVLSFDELSWPAEEQLSGKAGDVFCSSAHLLVTELAQLKNGRECLRGMVEELASYYNWQFAFLHAFQPAFQTQLDVEKWWALRSVGFAGRDLSQAWTVEESCQKLDQVLRSTVQIRTDSRELPLRADATLQTIIREWDAARQTNALRSKVTELALLRLRSAPEVAVLVDEYRQVLGAYLQNQFKATRIPPKGEPSSPGNITRETVKRLDALDARRDALRKTALPLTTAQNEPGSKLLPK